MGAIDAWRGHLRHADRCCNAGRRISPPTVLSPDHRIIAHPQELLKGIACVIILMTTEGTISSAYAVPSEALKTAIPALLYLCQNNLQYLGVTLLDAAT